MSSFFFGRGVKEFIAARNPGAAINMRRWQAGPVAYSFYGAPRLWVCRIVSSARLITAVGLPTTVEPVANGQIPRPAPSSPRLMVRFKRSCLTTPVSATPVPNNPSLGEDFRTPIPF